jgi:citrate synthase
MTQLKEVLRAKIEAHRPRTTKLLKESASVKIGDVTIGLRFRGYTIPETLEKLPVPAGQEMPLVEGFIYLLLTGDIPTEEQVAEVAEEFKARKKVPQYVFDVLNALPADSHPMVMFSAAIVSMQKESKFAKMYNEGLGKMEYWDPTYEDSLDLLARLPEIAAYIYRKKYKNGDIIPSDPNLDMGGNFAHMMGIDKPYDEVARLYFLLHSDHESGNVSAHAGHLVASALSDVYYATSAMINGLAGPLHGLANEQVLRWIQGVMDKMGGKTPNEEEMKKFVLDTLNSGQVIPGYGHAVLRKTDPRYTAQMEFCLEHLPDDPIFKYVNILYKVVPPILVEQGKAKNPWPNVDAQSGVIQWYYGLTEYEFYTVLFGIGRAIGVTANIIWDRALGYPIERPKSLTTAMLEDIVKKN